METTRDSGLAKGRRRRDEVLDLFERYRAETILRAKRALLLLMLSREDGIAGIDEIRADLKIPTGVNPACVAAAVTGLKSAGLIVAAGVGYCVRPESHGRLIHRWRLADPAQAQLWLRANPDPEEPPRPMDGPQHLLFGREA